MFIHKTSPTYFNSRFRSRIEMTMLPTVGSRRSFNFYPFSIPDFRVITQKFEEPFGNVICIESEKHNLWMRILSARLSCLVFDERICNGESWGLRIVIV